MPSEECLKRQIRDSEWRGVHEPLVRSFDLKVREVASNGFQVINL